MGSSPCGGSQPCPPSLLQSLRQLHPSLASRFLLNPALWLWELRVATSSSTISPTCPPHAAYTGHPQPTTPNTVLRTPSPRFCILDPAPSTLEAEPSTRLNRPSKPHQLAFPLHPCGITDVAQSQESHSAAPPCVFAGLACMPRPASRSRLHRT